MKALVLREYMKLVYEDVPRPEVAADEVLVKVEACGICGSDVHGLDGSTGRRQPPLIMGHEAAGTVADVGPVGPGLGERRPGDVRLDDLPARRLVHPARPLQPQRRPHGPRRLARRVPAARGLRRVRRGAPAHPLPGAGERELRAGGDGRAGGGGGARRAPDADRGGGHGGGGRRRDDRPLPRAGAARGRLLAGLRRGPGGGEARARPEAGGRRRPRPAEGRRREGGRGGDRGPRRRRGLRGGRDHGAPSRRRSAPCGGAGRSRWWGTSRPWSRSRSRRW